MALLARHRLLVCVGTGGVGKTTVAAALAVAAAARGLRAMVLTIDPARQLARSLGLSRLRLGGEVIAPDVLREAGLQTEGELSAGMLDEKTAWDGFVSRQAPTPAVAAAILGNSFYQQLSTGYAGTTEYMAIEELCRLHDTRRYDVIVLDTPPAAHALDFVRAPERIEKLLDPAIVRWLTVAVTEGGGGQRLARAVLHRLQAATGSEALTSVMGFFALLASLVDGIAERAGSARSLLRHPLTAFVLVASPHDHVLAETQQLAATMGALGMPIKGAVLNRVLPPLMALTVDAKQRAMLMATLRKEGIASDIVAHWTRSHGELLARARSEARIAARFVASLPSDAHFGTIAQRPSDAHRLADLVGIADELQASAAGDEKINR